MRVHNSIRCLKIQAWPIVERQTRKRFGIAKDNWLTNFYSKFSITFQFPKFSIAFQKGQMDLINNHSKLFRPRHTEQSKWSFVATIWRRQGNWSFWPYQLPDESFYRLLNLGENHRHLPTGSLFPVHENIKFTMILQQKVTIPKPQCFLVNGAICH